MAGHWTIQAEDVQDKYNQLRLEKGDYPTEVQSRQIKAVCMVFTEIIHDMQEKMTELEGRLAAMEP